MRTGRNDRPNDLTNVFIIVHLCFLQPSGYVASDGFDCTMQEESFPSKLEKLKGEKKRTITLRCSHVPLPVASPPALMEQLTHLRGKFKKESFLLCSRCKHSCIGLAGISPEGTYIPQDWRPNKFAFARDCTTLRCTRNQNSLENLKLEKVFHKHWQYYWRALVLICRRPTICSVDKDTL